MKKLIGCLLFSLSFILAPWVCAQSSPDPGVLVSGDNENSSVIELSSRDNSDSTEDKVQQQSDGNNSDTSNPSTDPIIIKATNAVMFQITANMKLSQDQIKIIQPIIMEYIVKVRDLQQSLEKGTIDGKTMYTQREQLYKEEDKELNHILTSDQMNVWANIQNT